MRQDQTAVLEALGSRDAYPHATRAIRLIETHISWVFLTGDFAYKVKKAVDLPYVDFSTLDKRERACRDELALNKRLAPALYHDVVTIGGGQGGVRVGGSPAIEYAVKMTQFPDGATADELISGDALDATELAELARTVAGFHQKLEPATGAPADERIRSNLEQLEAGLNDWQASLLELVAGWLRRTLDRVAETLQRRETAGRIRECHGDLHLGNIVRVDGRLIPFDCLEFSRDLRTIDVIDEVAFLLMDLVAHDRSDLGYVFLNSYLEITGDYDALRLLRLYAAHRALVRAKVALAAPDDASTSRASAYLEAAADNARASRPLCVVTSGYSGSGKTTIARRLAPSLGAVHIRSDVERKRLHGLASDAQTESAIAEGIYRQDATQLTYRRLADAAEAALSGAVDIIVDASFLDAEQRDRFHALARRLDARFVILHCAAPAEILRQRIIARQQERSDASEADLAVLAHQLATAAPFTDAEQSQVHSIDTESEIDADQLAGAIRSRNDQSSSSTSS